MRDSICNGNSRKAMTVQRCGFSLINVISVYKLITKSGFNKTRYFCFRTFIEMNVNHCTHRSIMFNTHGNVVTHILISQFEYYINRHIENKRKIMVQLESFAAIHEFD